jgi:hypothetical protein
LQACQGQEKQAEKKATHMHLAEVILSRLSIGQSARHARWIRGTH